MIQVPCRSPGHATPWVCGPPRCPTQLGFDSDRLAVEPWAALGKFEAARWNRVAKRRHSAMPPVTTGHERALPQSPARLVLRALCRANRWGARAFAVAPEDCVWAFRRTERSRARCLGHCGERRIAGLCRDIGVVEWPPQLAGRLQDRLRRHPSIWAGLSASAATWRGCSLGGTWKRFVWGWSGERAKGAHR